MPHILGLLRDGCVGLFFYLKVAGIIGWSWFWVTLPLWGPYALLVATPFIIMGLQVVINLAVKRSKKKQETIDSSTEFDEN